jgi:hypothetical protein
MQKVTKKLLFSQKSRKQSRHQTIEPSQDELGSIPKLGDSMSKDKGRKEVKKPKQNKG